MNLKLSGRLISTGIGKQRPFLALSETRVPEDREGTARAKIPTSTGGASLAKIDVELNQCCDLLLHRRVRVTTAKIWVTMVCPLAKVEH